MKQVSRKILIPFLIVVIFSSFYFGFYFGKQQCQICPPEGLDFSLFWEAYYKLKENFVDKEKIDEKKIIYEAISGMVKSLSDPYTTFLKPEEVKELLEDIEGVFEGIGIEIDIKKEKLQVIAPLEGTPAQNAGLLPGDKITKIDGISTSGMTLEEAVSRIRGPAGTEVTLTILREGWEEEKEFKIKRAVINVPSLKWELKAGEIAYLKINQFTGKTNSEFEKVAMEILTGPAKKIILDLRNNSGGLLSVAEDVAGWFLEREQLVVIIEGKKTEEHRAVGNGKFLGYPIVVLINQGSASGAEILAAALRDNRNVKLIGEKSFGKGSVQEPERLSDGSLLKITIAKWLTPKGVSIDEVGLEPDEPVKITEEDYEAGRDPQLDKAIEIIKEL